MRDNLINMPKVLRPLCRLLEIVAECHGVTIEEVLADGREGARVEARIMFCYMANKEFGLSSVRIGKLIGRTHATVLSNVASFQKKLDTIRYVKWAYDMVMEEITKELEK